MDFAENGHFDIAGYFQQGIHIENLQQCRTVKETKKKQAHKNNFWFN